MSVVGVQEEGGPSWSYSQGEIEDFLQSKQALPPELQLLIDARLVCERHSHHMLILLYTLTPVIKPYR